MTNEQKSAILNLIHEIESEKEHNIEVLDAMSNGERVYRESLAHDMQEELSVAGGRLSGICDMLAILGIWIRKDDNGVERFYDAKGQEI